MGLVFLSQQSLNFLLSFVYRSIYWHIFFKIGVLKNVTNFTGKYLWYSLILVKFTPYLSVFSPNAEKWDQNNSEYGHFLRSVLDWGKPVISAPVKRRKKKAKTKVNKNKTKLTNNILYNAIIENNIWNHNAHMTYAGIHTLPFYHRN